MARRKIASKSTIWKPDGFSIRETSLTKKKAKRRQISLSSKGPLMETALFSAASLFHGDDDSDDGRDEMEVGAEGKEEALEYVERAHEFPGMVNANLLWPGTFSFAAWLVKNQSILDGQRVLELGSGTGALAIYLNKSFGVDITTSDYDDKDIEENIAYNCRANKLDVLPHIRHTWGDPFPVSRPDWDIVVASDILLYVKQYDNLVKTVYFLLKEYKKSSEKSGCSTITDKSGTQVPAKSPMFLISWRRRIGKDQLLFFTRCKNAGLEVHDLGDLVYLVRMKS
ncbi:protein N-terminal and lysine N-methyltransferase EFM7-like isoform X2 [Panicum virgatum]|uniref:protein N-terminal and lysine N-methyltransferase EFM7-like isoform X2 n=1 Tax=Panicum virgatum TaxID=38727 RepID=UPI0019D52890|nr:protein N-terminal and lysine N-methyltransferase EFM7-like isoform X2 [Panicum virgatum]